MYLEAKPLDFVAAVAEKKKTDRSTIVNAMLKADMQRINKTR